MDLKFDVERVDDVRRRIAVEVPASTVTVELDRAYAELARSASVPGFRRGRVPRPVLERLFGDRVRSQVFERLIQESFLQAVEEGALPMVGHPEFETDAATPGAPLRYKAILEIKPEVTVDHYRGLIVDRPTYRIDEVEIDQVLSRLRDAHARLYPIEDRTHAQIGDVVTVDYEARSGGRTIGRAAKREIELGRNGLPAEFDQSLEGAHVGSHVRFEVVYPADHSNTQLAGQTVEFHVELQSLARKELPALDDDFAKANGDSDTVMELREKIRRGLEADAASRADEVLRQRLMEKLLELNMEIPVPHSLIDRRLHALVDEVWEDWRRQRIQPRDERAARDRLHRELGPRALNEVKMSLLLDAVAREEGLSVGEEEIDAQIQRLVDQAADAGERVRSIYQRPSARQQLRAAMLHSRAIDVIRQSAQVRAEPTEMIADAAKNG